MIHDPSDNKSPTPDDDGARVGITEEDVGGEFGFHLRWDVKGRHWADVIAWEVKTREDGQARYWKQNNSSAEDTANPLDAEPYLTGFVKWDGCCEFDFKETHFCGAHDLIKHFALLKHIYLRAGELCGHHHSESPWPTATKKV